MDLEGGDARQTLGNCALPFFPFFQSFFPERITERTVIIQLAFFSRHHPGRGCRSRRRITIGSFRQILAVDRNREENENQKKCSCQISHSFTLLDNSSNNYNAIYFEKTKCQGGKNKCCAKPGPVCHFCPSTRPQKAGKLKKSKRF